MTISIVFQMVMIVHHATRFGFPTVYKATVWPYGEIVPVLVVVVLLNVSVPLLSLVCQKHRFQHLLRRFFKLRLPQQRVQQGAQQGAQQRAVVQRMSLVKEMPIAARKSAEKRLIHARND